MVWLNKVILLYSTLMSLIYVIWCTKNIKSLITNHYNISLSTLIKILIFNLLSIVHSTYILSKQIQSNLIN